MNQMLSKLTNYFKRVYNQLSKVHSLFPLVLLALFILIVIKLFTRKSVSYAAPPARPNNAKEELEEGISTAKKRMKKKNE
ncbi:hypothetical protein A0H76_2713 [Hepatospora eriocheir]|uniref:Uncharacterized protein n=1 Tax=Hepatospora eriocheir TaxID=1081669 RepID=A0A1X0QJH0_9MICR|nr:hypothetical protein A0H76_2713 [Hepatospora eriocheir]